ncbi:MAG: hypothetical protein V4719_20175, partial [Planctomycetota bacterium]
FKAAPRLHTQVADWTNGERLLLVGADDTIAAQIAALYRAANRPLPTMQLFVTASGALERLADESFDCILVVNIGGEQRPRGADALSFCTAVRAAGSIDAILVLADFTSDPLWKATCEAEAELYVGLAPWHSATLLLLIDRAIQQRAAMRQIQRQNWAERQRLDREREECTELIRNQRQLLTDTPADQLGTLDGILPPELPMIYRELLRTYVMTGTTSFASEISKLAQTFALAHLTPRQVLQLHLDQLELLVKGIGQRSARHIVDRANIMCLDLMLLLCECFESQNARTWWAWRRQPVADLGLSLERRAA